MGARRMIRPAAKIVAGLLLVLAIAGAIVAALGWRLSRALDPDPVTVAAASLQAVREQAVLVPFAARFVAVVTSEQRRFGLSAKKTLIMPGLVRYELDLAALRQRDLRWDAATRTLSITLPPLRLTTPQIDLARTQAYGEGGVLMALTDAEARLDAANRIAAERELMAQARDALPMRLAREAARGALQRSFAMPLKAAGVEATVAARFADDPPAR
jgi:hypothetical protein